MIIKNEKERAALIEGGKRLGAILKKLAEKVAPGVSAEELNDFAEQMIREGGDTPAFLGYTPEGAARPYPAALCVSTNDEVVHGIPNEGKKILKEGDIVGLDLGLAHEGVIVDAATTVAVGEVDARSRELMRATKEALRAGIAAAVAGGRVGDVSAAIEKSFKGTGFSIVKALGGHGVGQLVHEEPFIPNYGRPGTGAELVEGHVLALEPIAAAGKAGVVLDADGYTYRTRDGSRSAHFEHTILLERTGATIVTKV